MQIAEAMYLTHKMIKECNLSIKYVRREKFFIEKDPYIKQHEEILNSHEETLKLFKETGEKIQHEPKYLEAVKTLEEYKKIPGIKEILHECYENLTKMKKII